VEETTIFINNGNAETNMPLQKYHFRLGQSERIVILKKNKDLSNKTHYSEPCMSKEGRRHPNSSLCLLI